MVKKIMNVLFSNSFQLKFVKKSFGIMGVIFFIAGFWNFGNYLFSVMFFLGSSINYK